MPIYFVAVIFPLFNSDTTLFVQLILKSTSRHFAKGSLIADSKELATGLMVITAGQVGVELPMDSAEADEENNKPKGTSLLYVFGRG